MWKQVRRNAWNKGLGQECLQAWMSGFESAIHNDHWVRPLAVQKRNHCGPLAEIPELLGKTPATIKIHPWSKEEMVKWEQEFEDRWMASNEQQIVSNLQEEDIIGQEKYWSHSSRAPGTSGKRWHESHLNHVRKAMIVGFKHNIVERGKECNLKRRFACKGCTKEWQSLWDRAWDQILDYKWSQAWDQYFTNQTLKIDDYCSVVSVPLYKQKQLKNSHRKYKKDWGRQKESQSIVTCIQQKQDPSSSMMPKWKPYNL